MSYSLLFFCGFLALLSCNSSHQSDEEEKNSGGQETLGEASEWFLSTGDWYKDPKIYVRTIGTGPDTVILLHGGWGGEHRYLIDATRGLEDKYYFVLYDQRGSLRSPFPDSLISFDNHITDLELIRKELGLTKIKIVGHSMGAVLACAYHAKFPGQVKSLTLLAPAPLKRPFPDEDQDLMQANNQKVQAFLQRPQVDAELNKLQLLRNDSRLSSREETSKFRISFAARFLYDIGKWRQIKGGGPFYNPQVDFLTSQTLPSDWDYPANFKKSKTPVTVILGDHDFLDMDASIIRKWTKDIPNVEVIVIEQAAHEIWVDQPQKFRSNFDHALRK
jgi:proline iminopeptidase